MTQQIQFRMYTKKRFKYTVLTAAADTIAKAKENVQFIHTTEHYSVLRKKEILQYATTQKDPKNITLSEISHSHSASICARHFRVLKSRQKGERQRAGRRSDGGMGSYCLL
jgi:hypothetical protein